MTPTEFTGEQFASAYPEGIEGHYWSMARNRIISRFLAKQGLKGKRMLEIGCGRGVVLRALRTYGFDCYGVDLAQGEVPHDLEGYLSYSKSFEDLDAGFIQSIEVVLLFDVIEHIEDEKKFLERIKQTFPHLSHIVFTVPARMEVWSNYDTYYGHFRRYTRPLLTSVARASGLRLLQASYFFHVLYLPARIFTLLKITRSVVVNSPTGMMAWVHRCTARCLELESIMLPASLIGTSIIGVMTKEDTASI